MSKEWLIEFQEKIVRTEDVASFRFLKPKNFSFNAGQFARILFDQEKENNSNLNKYLSFSSSPESDYLEFTKRLSNSEFSNKLNNLQKGEIIKIKGPLGDCIWPEDKFNLLFIIGGIGITPVISMLSYWVNRPNLERYNIYLFYANRLYSNISFKKELLTWQNKYSNFLKVYFIITETIDGNMLENDFCLSGPMREEIISEYCKDYNNRLIFAFGPPGFVKVVQGQLENLGVKKENICLEKFIGY